MESYATHYTSVFNSPHDRNRDTLTLLLHPSTTTLRLVADDLRIPPGYAQMQTVDQEAIYA